VAEQVLHHPPILRQKVVDVQEVHAVDGWIRPSPVRVRTTTLFLQGNFATKAIHDEYGEVDSAQVAVHDHSAPVALLMQVVTQVRQVSQEESIIAMWRRLLANSSDPITVIYFSEWTTLASSIMIASARVRWR